MLLQHINTSYCIWCLTQLVLPPSQGGGSKREPGVNPGLPRSVQELANFFERRVSAYQVGITGSVEFDEAF